MNHKRPTIYASTNVDDAPAKAKAYLAQPRFDGLSDKTRRNKGQKLKFHLRGASMAKRRFLRKSAVERQRGHCFGCGAIFSEVQRPVLSFFVKLADGGVANAFNSCAECQACHDRRRDEIVQRREG